MEIDDLNEVPKWNDDNFYEDDEGENGNPIPQRTCANAQNHMNSGARR